MALTMVGPALPVPAVKKDRSNVSHAPGPNLLAACRRGRGAWRRMRH